MVKLHLDKKKFTAKLNEKDKKDSEQIRYLSKRITKEISDVTPKELAESLTQGQSMVLGVMGSHSRRKTNTNYQEAIALDIDNNNELFYMTIEQALQDKFIKENASFIYTTFSHTPEHHKFRVVFMLDRTLTNCNQVEELIKTLLGMYPNADTACKDGSRLFYGGKEYFEIDFNNKLNPYKVVSKLPGDSPIIERVEKQTESHEDKVKSTIKKPSKSKVVNISEYEVSNRTCDLIKAGKDDEVRERLSIYKQSLKSNANAMEYIRRLDMGEVLGLPTNENFRDVTQEDDNPSTSIYLLDDIYLYTRQSSDPDKAFTGNLIQVVAKLKNTSFIGAFDYLLDVMEIDFNVSERVQQLVKEIEIYTTLLDSSELKESYPSIHKIFKDGRSYYATDVIRILNIIKDNVIEVDGEIRLISQLTLAEFSRRIYGNTLEKNTKRVGRVINLMANTEWITKIKFSDLPKDIQSKVIKFKKVNDKKRPWNVIEFKELGSDFFQLLNRLCEVMIDKRITVSALTKESLALNYGQEHSDKIYVHDEGRTVSKKTMSIIEESLYFINEQLEANGYVEEQAVREHLSQFIGKTYSTKKFREIRNHLVEAYGFKVANLNKALKKELNVPSDKYSPTQSPKVILAS